jgi:hypothetical protein
MSEIRSAAEEEGCIGSVCLTQRPAFFGLFRRFVLASAEWLAPGRALPLSHSSVAWHWLGGGSGPVVHAPSSATIRMYGDPR